MDPPMTQLIARRLMSALLTMAAVSVIVFLATEILPGDAAQIALGQSALPETVEALRREMGLDRPAAVRYLAWIGNLMQGDLGVSTGGRIPIADMVAERLRNTLILGGLAALAAVPLALALGILAAMHPRGWLDRAVSSGALALVSLPEFLLATLLINLLAVRLQLFPPIAYMRAFEGFGPLLHMLALPVITLSCFVGAQMVRMTRASLLNVLGRDFVEMAVLKGVPRRQIILRHALPNAIGPIANIVALALAYLVSGVVVAETVFAYPGLAKLMVEAVQVRDLALVQACAMIFCTAYVLLIAAADVIQIAANPRLRRAARPA